MSYRERVNEDQRLIILRELSRELDYRLNETILTAVLESFGHRVSRDMCRTQLRKLEELGAVQLAQAGSVFVATLTRAGLDHVESRSVIEGVLRPSPEV
ncbi:hypothetical protein [Roseibium litorale]|uniref:ArsR family transcriptional regulator n=1 Tax=Roseibium litorale TaxID=2803841 RepID=A0ABR9CHD2_9HYPH|nr:hypothetical protein [Roseibium litorale]MBD8890163.1 hypothetical protein [Roseibium litorale]